MRGRRNYSMNTYKLGVRIFVSNPEAVTLRDFIPVFHAWIQQQKLPGHQFIDVHDYSHVHHGPGILLVAHEANLSIDEAQGRRGLVYIRKQPGNLSEIVKAAFDAAKILETEQGVKFDAGTFEVFSNDRLLAPNTAEARTELEPVIKSAFAGAAVTLAPEATDPRERLAFVVKRG